MPEAGAALEVATLSFSDVVRRLAGHYPQVLEVKAHWVAVTLDDRRDVVAQVTDGEIRWSWGGLAIFHAALCNACEMRGWDWGADGNVTWSDSARRYGATVFRPGEGPSFIHRAYAQAAALAFALALLEALEASPGGQ